MQSSFQSLVLAVVAGLAVAWSAPASAVEEFEVEEAEVEKGEVEFQYVGHQFWGFPGREFVITNNDAAEFEFELDRNEQARQRHYFELGMGLTNWFGFSIAAEFEEERLEDVGPGVAGFADREKFGDLKFSDIEAEFKLVAIPLKGDGVGLTLFSELGTAAEKAEGSVFGFGPIIKTAHGPWSMTLNPVFTKHFGGDDEFEVDGAAAVLEQRFDDRWDFNYGWQLAYQMSDKITLTAEGFGTVQRLGGSGVKFPEQDVLDAVTDAGGSPGGLFRDHDQHFVGPVLYYKIGGSNEAAGGDDDEGGKGEEAEVPTLTLGMGVLFGLNDDSADAALKWSLEAEF